ncbi:hypothetical protein AGMMS49546_32360 [Spirochaetia bacterium]|nr:hypothetical protein AGMMS49546_32310 [Spirochaetia bacterium]GHV45762.1 hypothetical protein AGMMS49546_32360 [Spirochaetia bacterium]
MNNIKYFVGSELINNQPMCPFNDIICDFVADFSERLRNSSVAKRYPDIIALAFWARKGNILKLKEKYSNFSDRLGRGLVFHIAPSNIPVNFAFSYLFSLLAGNANIVRVPSKPFPQVSILCDVFIEALENFPKIKAMTAFIGYPVDNKITEAFCEMADARIVWGGDQTVENIRQLKTKPRCVDVVFPDRYSFAIINGKSVDEVPEQELQRLAGFFYNDTYLMDQNACSSPQIIFWQDAKTKAKERFWNAVVDIAREKYDLQPAISIDKYVQSCKDAIEYDSLDIIRDGNILYRIGFSSLPEVNLTALRGKGGYFYEYDLDSLDEFIPYINEKYQTVTYYGIEPNVIKDFVLKNRLCGIDRVVPIGSAMDIGLIWDGYDLINMLSRVVFAV